MSGVRVCLASVSVDDVQDMVNISSAGVPDAEVLRMTDDFDLNKQIKKNENGFHIPIRKPHLLGEVLTILLHG